MTRFQILHILEFRANAADLALAQRDSEARHVWAGRGAEGLVVCPYSSLRAAFRKIKKTPHFHLYTHYTLTHSQTDRQKDTHAHLMQLFRSCT